MHKSKRNKLVSCKANCSKLSFYHDFRRTSRSFAARRCKTQLVPIHRDVFLPVQILSSNFYYSFTIPSHNKTSSLCPIISFPIQDFFSIHYFCLWFLLRTWQFYLATKSSAFTRSWYRLNNFILTATFSATYRDLQKPQPPLESALYNYTLVNKHTWPFCIKRISPSQDFYLNYNLKI